jgi:hypothetical protein
MADKLETLLFAIGLGKNQKVESGKIYGRVLVLWPYQFLLQFSGLPTSAPRS